jgi:WD40 repeat protein
MIAILIVSSIVTLVGIIIGILVLVSQKSRLEPSQHMTFLDGVKQYKLVDTIRPDNIQAGDKYGVISFRNDYLLIGAPSKDDGNIFIYDKLNILTPIIINETEKAYNNLSLSKNGTFAILLFDREMHLYSRKGQEFVLMSSIATFHDENYEGFMSCSEDFSEIFVAKGHNLERYTMKSQALMQVETKHVGGECVNVEVSGNGYTVAVGMINHSVILYKVHKNKLQNMKTFATKQKGFGLSLALSYTGDVLIVGSPLCDDMRGSVAIFQACHKWKWRSILEYKILNLEAGDRFGYVSVSKDGLIFSVAAPSQKNTLPNGKVKFGAIYIFKRNSKDMLVQLTQKIVYPGDGDSIWTNFGKKCTLTNSELFVSSDGCNEIASEGGVVHKFAT